MVKNTKWLLMSFLLAGAITSYHGVVFADAPVSIYKKSAGRIIGERMDHAHRLIVDIFRDDIANDKASRRSLRYILEQAEKGDTKSLYELLKAKFEKRPEDAIKILKGIGSKGFLGLSDFTKDNFKAQGRWVTVLMTTMSNDYSSHPEGTEDFAFLDYQD